jgi:hypothetical protein
MCSSVARNFVLTAQRSFQSTPDNRSAYDCELQNLRLCHELIEPDSGTQTPGLTASSGTARTPSSHTQLSPFAPHTPFARSASNPVTPLTPYYASSGVTLNHGFSSHSKDGVVHVQETAEEIGRYLLVSRSAFVNRMLAARVK